jgi:hypothetical protein
MGTSESNVEETQTMVETAIESTIETVIETTEALTIEESSIVDETSKESSVIESEESSIYEETSTMASSELSKETVTNETPVVETQVESVVETAQETTTTTTSSSYSADEYISIVKSELIKNGIQWCPDSDEYKEFPEFGLDGGMGWAIIDVDMSNPYYVSEELLDGFKFDRLEYFYIEVLSSSNGNIQFKLYRG